MKYTVLHNNAVTKQWTAKWRYVANVVFRVAQNYGEQSYFRGFGGEIASPGSAPVVRLVTVESTRFDNKDSEPKAQVKLLKFPEENSIFLKTHIVKSILSFSQCQNENECFSRKENCRTAKWKNTKINCNTTGGVPSQI